MRITFADAVGLRQLQSTKQIDSIPTRIVLGADPVPHCCFNRLIDEAVGRIE